MQGMSHAAWCHVTTDNESCWRTPIHVVACSYFPHIWTALVHDNRFESTPIAVTKGSSFQRTCRDRRRKFVFFFHPYDSIPMNYLVFNTTLQISKLNIYVLGAEEQLRLRVFLQFVPRRNWNLLNQRTSKSARKQKRIPTGNECREERSEM